MIVSMKIRLRPAEPSDKEFVRQVHHLGYKDVVTRQFGTWDETVQDSFFAKDWAKNKMEIILCDEKECGYASRKRKPEFYWVGELVLLPKFQGCGIGSGILRDVMTMAAAENIPVRLQVLFENYAHRLYLRLGFVDTGKTETHYLMEWNP